jgi:hypothetical protein
MQEYFDKGLSNLMEKIENTMDTKLEVQTKELKEYTHQAFEIQQEYLDERFGELIVKYDVRDRVEKLEKEFRDFKLKKTIHA